jgi:AraC-like DNA-binding protein
MQIRDNICPYFLNLAPTKHMRYNEYPPSLTLKDYVQCYFTCETDSAVTTEDSVYASGFVEIMFNLGAGPQKLINGKTVVQPRAQLWGQTIQPFSFTSSGKHAMLGVRFYPHTAACFFDEPVDTFNDQVVDYVDVAGRDGRELYAQLLEAIPLYRKIDLLEKFLLARLRRFEHRFAKLKLMNAIVSELNNDDFFRNINTVSARYGMTPRYLQKLFLSYSGISPHLFSKITRFQKSLQLITKNDLQLTTVAHQCGYYDQSHFIKDFKNFTGLVPSHFRADSSSELAVSLTG